MDCEYTLVYCIYIVYILVLMSYLVTQGVAESDWLGVRVQVLIPPDKRDTDSVKYSHIVRLHTPRGH